MSATVKLTVLSGIGLEHTLTLPAKYEVCDRCEGEGKIVNPSVDGKLQILLKGQM